MPKRSFGRTEWRPSDRPVPTKSDRAAKNRVFTSSQLGSAGAMPNVPEVVVRTKIHVQH